MLSTRTRFFAGLLIILLLSVIFTAYMSQVVDRTPTNFQHPQLNEPEDLPPCGEVCSYGGRIIKVSGQYYPQRDKQIHCNNIMRRMAYKNHTIVFPPPEYPPDHLLDEFTMYGEMPISKMQYFDANWTANRRIFSDIEIRTIIHKFKEGNGINMYQDDKCVQNMLLKYTKRIRGKRGVVIGTELPWLESLVLALGATNVTTLEYAPIKCEREDMTAYTPYDFAELFLKGQVGRFDFAVSFSSIEHSGLGRYSDPLNPYGDLEAMAQVWCMLEPGGMFAIGIPGEIEDSNYIIWNANRVYGKVRLQQLTASWNFVEMTQCPDIFHHYFIILSKPY